MERNLTLETVRITEAAALAATRHLGRGDGRAVDHAAAQAIHGALNTLSLGGHVVIGERQKKGGSLLKSQDIVGLGVDPQIDIALNPIEGALSVANGGVNAISVIAFADAGVFAPVPDIYMEKMAIGPGLPHDLVSLDEEPVINLRELARAKRVAVSDLVVCILDRPRHGDIIQKIRASGACISLISDGDISAMIATARPDSGIDAYMGSGGAFEGVLAAAALRCIGGVFQGRLIAQTDEEKALVEKSGFSNANKIFGIRDLVKGDVLFAATGVTHGSLLKGVSRYHGGAKTHSVVMRSDTGTIRFIETQHAISQSHPLHGGSSL